VRASHRGEKRFDIADPRCADGRWNALLGRPRAAVPDEYDKQGALDRLRAFSKTRYLSPRRSGAKRIIHRDAVHDRVTTRRLSHVDASD
jgi:hypothetical protein